MANPRTGNIERQDSESEHIGPDYTGDNISAKKVANYNWDGSTWQRLTKPLTAGKDFDYIDIQQTSATVETYVYKLGGAVGTVVQTIVVTYTDATKADIDKVEYS